MELSEYVDPPIKPNVLGASAPLKRHQSFPLALETLRFLFDLTPKLSTGMLENISCKWWIFSSIENVVPPFWRGAKQKRHSHIASAVRDQHIKFHIYIYIYTYIFRPQEQHPACYIQIQLHPRNLTWNLKISHWKRKVHLETFIFRFHVKFRGCIGLWNDEIPRIFGRAF